MMLSCMFMCIECLSRDEKGRVYKLCISLSIDSMDIVGAKWTDRLMESDSMGIVAVLVEKALQHRANT